MVRLALVTTRDFHQIKEKKFLKITERGLASVSALPLEDLLSLDGQPQLDHAGAAAAGDRLDHHVSVGHPPTCALLLRPEATLCANSLMRCVCWCSDKSQPTVPPTLAPLRNPIYAWNNEYGWHSAFNNREPPPMPPGCHQDARADAPHPGIGMYTQTLSSFALGDGAL